MSFINRAIADYTKAIQLDPNSTDAYINRGLAWYKKREYNKAVGDLTEAIRLDPKSALAHQSHAQAYRALGDELNAASDDQRAQELSK